MDQIISLVRTNRNKFLYFFLKITKKINISKDDITEKSVIISPNETFFKT